MEMTHRTMMKMASAVLLVALLSVQAAQAQSSTDHVPSDSDSIYWCPMRGGFCGLHDFTEPGQCDVCEMDLVTKSDWIAVRTRDGAAVASDRTEWSLSREGAKSLYFCIHRGRADHELVPYREPGVCPIDGEPLIHAARFSDVRTYSCLTPDCSRYGFTFYSDGMCPECGVPVQAHAHTDHNPQHGGYQFFMASNLFHHLEGTMPVPGTFMLYVYDDLQRPLDARTISGSVSVLGPNAETIALKVLRGGDAFLVAEIPQDYPIELQARVMLAGEEHIFDFVFDEITLDPSSPLRSGAAAFAEVLRLSREMEETIENEEWGALNRPILLVKLYATWLPVDAPRYGPAATRDLDLAMRAIKLGANMMESSLNDNQPLPIKRGYARFREGLEAYVSLFEEGDEKED